MRTQKHFSSWLRRQPIKNRQAVVAINVTESDCLIKINECFCSIYTVKVRLGMNIKHQTLSTTKAIVIDLNKNKSLLFK